MRPSSLPILAQCPQFASAGGSAYTEAGTLRHKAVEALFRAELNIADEDYERLRSDILNDLESEDREAVEWASDYIKIHAPAADYPMLFERRVSPIGDDFQPLFRRRISPEGEDFKAEFEDGGTLDLECGPELFDFKSRPRDYWPQLAAYALALIQEHGYAEVRCHVLFMVTRSYEVRVLTEADCWALITPIMENAGKGEANPCDYCGWCAKQLTCPAKLKQVNAVVAGREDWALEQYHASQIQTPEEMGKALTLARSLNKWCEAVEHFAKEMVQKQGAVPAGYEVKPSKGKAYIADTAEAFRLAGLEQDTFLKCCDVWQNTSKKYPDKLGLADALAQRDGIAKSRAAKIIKEKLSPVIMTGKDGIKLVPIKGGDDDNEE